MSDCPGSSSGSSESLQQAAGTRQHAVNPAPAAFPCASRQPAAPAHLQRVERERGHGGFLPRHSTGAGEAPPWAEAAAAQCACAHTMRLSVSVLGWVQGLKRACAAVGPSREQRHNQNWSCQLGRRTRRGRGVASAAGRVAPDVGGHSNPSCLVWRSCSRRMWASRWLWHQGAHSSCRRWV
jgi:hypothetical protein